MLLSKKTYLMLKNNEQYIRFNDNDFIYNRRRKKTKLTI